MSIMKEAGTGPQRKKKVARDFQVPIGDRQAPYQWVSASTPDISNAASLKSIYTRKSIYSNATRCHRAQGMKEQVK